MNRRRFITLAVGAGSLLGWPGIPPKSLARGECKSWALGTDVSLVAYHEDRAIAEQALSAAFKALDDIEDVLSLYRPHYLALRERERKASSRRLERLTPTCRAS